MPYPWNELDVLTASDLNAAFAARALAADVFTPVYAKLQRQATQSIPNDTNEQIDWDTAIVDSHGGWASSPNPSRWTCPSGCAGWYAYSGIASFQNNSTNQRAVHLLKNGAGVDGSQVILNGSASATSLSIFHSGLIDLNEGDYIEVNVYQFSGGALNISPTALTRCTLNLWRVAAA